MSVTTSKSAHMVRVYDDEDTPVQEAVLQTPGQRPPVARNGRTPRSRGMPQAIALALPLVLALILLLGWYAITTGTGRVNSLLLPTPADVLSSLLDGLTSGVFLSNTLITIQESLLGFLLAVAVALPLGYGIAKSRLLAMTIQPYVVAGQAIPAIVIAPLLVILLPYGVALIILCMLVVLFPMIINTILGVQTIDRTLLEAARVEGASGWSMLANIEFPLALPAILAGIRTGLTLSVVGALVGEFVASGDRGLGSLVQIALHQYNPPFMFATVVVLAALAVVYYGVTWLLVKLADAIY